MVERSTQRDCENPPWVLIAVQSILQQEFAERRDSFRSHHFTDAISKLAVCYMQNGPW